METETLRASSLAALKSPEPEICEVTLPARPPRLTSPLPLMETDAASASSAGMRMSPDPEMASLRDPLFSDFAEISPEPEIPIDSTFFAFNVMRNLGFQFQFELDRYCDCKRI